MSFYEQISTYYDFIFPVGGEQLEFIRQSTGQPPKKVLDVACGSGGYTVELAKKGYEVTAVDLEEEMVNKAREKAGQNRVKAEILQCDMTQLRSKLEDQYDSIFCIGNSIAHLGTHKEILEALKQMGELLDKNGVLILQMINYDRVIKFNVSELPAIRDDSIGLQFNRNYEYNPSGGLIHFNTKLTVKQGHGEEVFENSIPLLPIKSGDMMKLLKDAGFSRIEVFGDFSFSSFDENSYLLVVRAGK